jgi:hypothetical protein
MPAMSTRTILSLSMLLGLCATGCPESKTDTAPEPKSPDESAKVDEAPKAEEPVEDEKEGEGDEKDEEGGW